MQDKPFFWLGIMAIQSAVGPTISQNFLTAYLVQIQTNLDITVLGETHMGLKHPE